MCTLGWNNRIEVRQIACCSLMFDVDYVSLMWTAFNLPSLQFLLHSSLFQKNMIHYSAITF